MKSIVGKKVLITGAASGIGRLMAHGFAKEGSECIISDINQQGLNAVTKEIEQLGGKVHAYACDISNEAMVQSVLEKIDKEVGTIDILIKNAGIVLGKKIVDLTIDDFRKTMNVNFFGHLLFTKHYLPDMIKRNAGHIVNIASSAGLQGFPRAADYNASKFAEVGFTEALRLELKKYGNTGVKTTIICPYVIDTGMFKGFKPILFNPILQPDYVVSKVISAVKKEKPMVKIPFTVNLTLLMKLFPVGFADWVCSVTGLTGSMDKFEGH
jgi:all-trans-retinol dehydrogenase (NAD+)